MTVWHRILIAAALSWTYSVTLGLLYAISAADNYSPKVLLLPGVIPVALYGSTIAAIEMLPLAIWAVRTGTRNLWFYGPILWVALAAFIFLAMPRLGHYSYESLLFVAVVGLIVLGFVPAR